MRFAFCLFRYFPYGGLQRDFLRIARECMKRGHIVDVYTMRWEGNYEPGLAIRLLPAKGLQNHTRRDNFAKQVQPYLEKNHYDLIVGFNKMPGLDVYYAADTCYQAKAREQHSWWYRLTKRYRHSVSFESAVFDENAKTEILLIAEKQQAEFMHYYKTPTSRFHLLPPGIEKERFDISARAASKAIRKEYALGDEFLLLMVGSGFKTKGLDRSLTAIAALPLELKNHVRLFVLGNDDARPFLRQAKRLGILDRVTFLGGRSDVPEFLAAADILLHPAYNENTGTVLLEAIVSGLPVLTTDVCGYADYIKQANAGIVIPSPFKQAAFNQALMKMLTNKTENWQANGLEFAKTADIYSMPERAVDLLENLR